MDINRQQRRLFVSLVSLLTTAFLGTISLSYFVASNAIRKNIIEDQLPLTGDSIYSEIQRDLIKPVFVSDQMAHNTFLLDWITSGEREPKAVFRYLSEIRQRYDAITSFYVSEKSRRYFTPTKIGKVVSETNPEDRWFFRVRQMKELYEINIESDPQNKNRITAFINFRVVDEAGQFLGATGVGLGSDNIFKLVEEYKRKFNRDVIFYDLQGNSSIYDPVTKTRAQSLHDRSGIGFLATLGALGLTLWLVARYQQRLIQLAVTDGLTGITNRWSGEADLAKVREIAKLAGETFSLMVIDCDRFKQVNDEHGHLVGDVVIREIAQVIRQHIRRSDCLVRWGGEEFVVLLPNANCTNAVNKAEVIRQAIADRPFKIDRLTLFKSVSIGVAEWDRSESNDSLFARADAALLHAKQSGRNCVMAATANDRS